jgi:integrase
VLLPLLGLADEVMVAEERYASPSYSIVSIAALHHLFGPRVRNGSIGAIKLRDRRGGTCSDSGRGRRLGGDAKGHPEPLARWTIHDLRRTARSLMTQAGVAPDHAERALGHVIAGMRGVYDRHDYHAEKRAAFEALAARLDLILNPRANVVPLRPTGKTG